MNCAEIREILLTDYIDDEASDGLRETVDKHLKECAACREYYALIREKIVHPLDKRAFIKTPPEVWRNIRSKIYKDPAAYETPGILQRIRERIVFNKPAIVFASFLLMIILGTKGARIYTDNMSRDFMERQMLYLAGVEDENGDSSGFSTSIEEYFF